MARKAWWRTAMPQQLMTVRNFQAKIGGNATALGLTPVQVADAEALCQAFIDALDATEQCKTAMQAMTQWRDNLLHGEGGKAAPPAPVFPVVAPVTVPTGIVREFFALRDLIVALPGYTVGIGEDLGIVGPEITPRPADEVAPLLKPTVSNGNWVNLHGSMQGMDAMRVEYKRKGGSFQTVAYLTTTPGGFQLTPAVPDEPENGHIRAVFMKKNAQFGNYSADYPVTLT